MRWRGAGLAPAAAVHSSGGGNGAPPTGGAARAKHQDTDGGGNPSSSEPSDDFDGGGERSQAPPSSSDEDEEYGLAISWANVKINKPGIYYKDFEIPRRAVRPDGLPVTFEPLDVGFLSAFSDNVRDRMEAASLYQVCYWLQEAVNKATDSYHNHANFSPTDLETCFGTLVIDLTRIQRIAVKRFDYPEAKQSDPLLAREYERTDLPAANQHRGFGMRAFRKQRDEYRIKNAAKISAYHATADKPVRASGASKKLTPYVSSGGAGDGGGGGEGGSARRRRPTRQQGGVGGGRRPPPRK